MHRLNICIAAVCLSASLASAVDLPPTSRCYGTLTITPKTLAWLTTFSQCPAARYRIIDRNGDRITFHLNHLSAKCRYEVVSLNHHAGEPTDMGWEVWGYRNESRYREHKAGKFTANAPDVLSCYLIRDAYPDQPSDW
jgi:hypothetical protein